MSLFEVRDAFGVHNPFENPSIPLQSIGLDYVFGNASDSDTGVTVTEENSLAIPTMWRCVGLMATVIAGCPVRAYRNPNKEEFFPKLFNTSNPVMMYTQYELWELVVAHIALWGNAFIYKVRDDMDRVVDLKPINPQLVKVKLMKVSDDGGKQVKLFELTRVNKDGSINNTAPPITLTTWEIMHIPGLGFDGVQGCSPVQLAARTIGTAVAADKLAAKFYSQGTLLSGVINVRAPLANQTQADEIRRKWAAKNGGMDHTAEVAVLDAETTFQPLTIPPEALQFLESRRWQTTEIARWFGIPPHLVGDVEKSTSWGTGIEQQNVGFISYTVAGWTNRIEQRITRELIKGNNTYVEFDLDRLMRGSMQERFAAYNTAINSGWLNRNEVRIKENELPKPGLDVFLTPANMVAGNPPTAKQMQSMAPPAPSDDDSDQNGPAKSGDSDNEDDS